MNKNLMEAIRFGDFMERVLEKKEEWVGVLKSSGDPNQMFRAQGFIAALEFVQELPERMKEEEEEKSRESGVGSQESEDDFED